MNDCFISCIINSVYICVCVYVCVCVCEIRYSKIATLSDKRDNPTRACVWASSKITTAMLCVKLCCTIIEQVLYFVLRLKRRASRESSP